MEIVSYGDMVFCGNPNRFPKGCWKLESQECRRICDLDQSDYCDIDDDEYWDNDDDCDYCVSDEVVYEESGCWDSWMCDDGCPFCPCDGDFCDCHCEYD